MKIVFVGPTDPALETARRLEGSSKDGMFSAVELAQQLGIPREEAQRSLDRLEEWGACGLVDDLSVPPSGTERWTTVDFALTVGREYEVLGIAGDHYIILTDSDTQPYGDDPFLFHQTLFRVTDSTEPSFWMCDTDEDGERHCLPREWHELPHFFEQYHDRVREVRTRFWRDLERYYPETAKERGCDPLANPATQRTWRDAIERWRRSNLTIGEFCEEAHLGELSFRFWRRQLETGEAAGRSSDRERRDSREESGGEDTRNASSAEFVGEFRLW